MAVTHVLERIQKKWSVVEEIRDQCGVGAISVGILHEGKVLFTGSVGRRDHNKDEHANPQTLYTIASVSKSFVVAALGILVDQGKCKWTDPVGPYLPEFSTNSDPRVAAEATFNDILRHSGGLANPIVSVLGPGGKVLVPEEDFIKVLNDTPTGNEDFGLYFNATWEYSNVGYGLVVLVIERLSGRRFADLVSEEILKPLGMNDTVVFKSQLDNNDNVARPYVRLSDGSWYAQPEHEWTDDTNSPILGVFGIRSSIKDLLTWSAAMMDAKWGDVSRPLSALSGLSHNPLKEVNSILNNYYWLRRTRDDVQNKCNYHLAWLKCVMPSAMLHWGSWNKSLADNSHGSQEQINKDILGRNSPKRTLYKTTGIGYCGTCSLNFFPKTMSAVVVLSSGLNLGDPSDFTAALMIQELFELEEPVDIIPMVRREVDVRLADWSALMAEWEANRLIPKVESPVKEFAGTYEGLGISIEIRLRQRDQLEVVFNGREEIAQQLELYNTDMYSYLPRDRDAWLRGAWLDWDYYKVGILHFQRDKATNQVSSLAWTWERRCDPAIFTKRQQVEASSTCRFM